MKLYKNSNKKFVSSTVWNQRKRFFHNEYEFWNDWKNKNNTVKLNIEGCNRQSLNSRHRLFVFVKLNAHLHYCLLSRLWNDDDVCQTHQSVYCFALQTQLVHFISLNSEQFLTELNRKNTWIFFSIILFCLSSILKLYSDMISSEPCTKYAYRKKCVPFVWCGFGVMA